MDINSPWPYSFNTFYAHCRALLENVKYGGKNIQRNNCMPNTKKSIMYACAFNNKFIQTDRIIGSGSWEIKVDLKTVTKRWFYRWGVCVCVCFQRSLKPSWYLFWPQKSVSKIMNCGCSFSLWGVCPQRLPFRICLSYLPGFCLLRKWETWCTDFA